MRRIIFLSLFALLVSGASAQRRGGAGPSFARGGLTRGGPRRVPFYGNFARGIGGNRGISGLTGSATGTMDICHTILTRRLMGIRPSRP